MRYQIFTCTHAKQLCESIGFSGAGDPGGFVPLERCRDGKLIKTRAAMPGYIFLSKLGVVHVDVSLSSRFNMRPMLSSDNVYCYVDWSELLAMQKILNKEFEGPAPTEIYDFQPGETLRLLSSGAATGLEVEFARYKGSARGRVYLNGKHLDVPLSSLSRNV